MPDTDSDLSAALRAEQTRLHAQVLPVSVAVNVLLASLAAAVLRGHADPSWLGGWLAALALAALLRAGVHAAQRQAVATAPTQPGLLLRYRATLLVLGLAWAGAGGLLFALPPGPQLDLLIIGLAGLAAGALMTHGFDLTGALLYAAPPGLLLLLFGLLAPHDSVSPMLAAAALLLTTAVPSVARAHRVLAQTARGRLALEQRAEELRQAVRMVDRTGAIASVGGWSIDADPRRLALTAQATKLLDLPADARPTLEQVLCRLDADGATGLARAIDAALADGTPISLDLSFVTVQGRELKLHLEGQARRADGRITGIDGALQDVTRLHAIDRALTDQHRRFDQLLRTTRQGVWLLDPAGRGTELNAAMAELLGRPPDQVLGRPASDFVGIATHDRLTAATPADPASDGAHELTLTRPDGSRRRCLVHVSPLLDARGVREGSVALWTDITARWEAEQAQRVSETVINATTEMISVVDENDVFRMVNDAWVRTTGLARERVIGLRAPEVLPQVVNDERLRAIRTCLGEQRRVTVRAEAHFPGQPQRVLHSEFYPVRVDAHGPRLAAIVTRDVTQEDAQHDALVAGADFLRGTLDATGDAIFATDSPTGDEPPRFANDQLFALWCMRDLQHSGASVQRLGEAMYAASADPAAERARVDAIVAAGAPVQDRLLLRDGRVVVRRFAPVPLRGRLLRVWSFRDVTAEVRAIEARESAAAEQRALFDNFPGYIAVLDETLRYRHVNDGLLRLLGRPRSEVIGRVPADVLDDRAGRRVDRAIDRALQLGQAVSESHFDRPDGQGPLDLEVTHVAGPLHADGSRAIFAFGVDITERKRAQAALVDALAEAERANAAKSRFLSHMSHELRTPLNAVLGFGQLLSAQPLAPAQRRHVDEVLRGGRHLLSLINDLLDLNRIEAGALEVACQPVDARAALDDAVGLLLPLAQERQVQLARAANAAAAVVSADPGRLRQVLLNLVANAIKYNRSGGSVVAEAEVIGAEVELRVRDDGPGISAEEQQRLFRPFERLQADSAGPDGTGIGLALSRHLVEAMGGRIGIDSRRGEGSTFWVRLPEAVAAPESAPEPGTDAAQPAPRRARALYIEDNPVNLMLMAAMLEDELDLATEADPVLGLKAALDTVPDVILLDIQLPGMNGFEVLRHLRADTRTCRVPVVAVSANAMPADLAAGRAAGFDAYVTKPVDLDGLLRTLRDVLRPAARSDGPCGPAPSAAPPD